MDIPSSQQSTPTGHQKQHQLPVSTPTFMIGSITDSPARDATLPTSEPIRQPRRNAFRTTHGKCSYSSSFHQYTVEGDEHPMTVGQCLDYVLQQQADQVNAFKDHITDAVHGIRVEIKGMRQDINELIDLVKRLETIKNKRGVKDDKKGQDDNKKSSDNDKKEMEDDKKEID
jgi:hypothetical protein